MTIFATIQRMARLYKQALMTKVLDDFFKKTGYNNEQTYYYRVHNLNQQGVPKQDFLGYLTINRLSIKDKIQLWINPNYFEDHGNTLDRTYKIDRLYQSCLDDDFIKDDNGILKVTHRGTDLIQIAGFINILLEKYGKIQLFLLGGGATGILWITVHFWHLIKPLL